MNRPVQIALDYKIRTPLDELPADIRLNVVEALTIPNLAKLEAKKQHEWGWERLPDKIETYSIEGGNLVMPRGFMMDFAEGLMLSGYEFDLEDRRQWDGQISEDEPWIKLRPWQAPAVDAMFANQQGIYKAPAGSGKTVAILGLIERLQCKSLIIVNTKDIMWQWLERVGDFLPGFERGQVGDGKFEVSDHITVATAQTINSRFEKLESTGFFDEFSLVCLDECHHATAGTYNSILDRFSSRYRLGVSATPDKTGDFALAQLVLGPIIHTTRPADVDALMRPLVVQVPTDFKFGFKGTQSRWQKSNYGKMIETLVRSDNRNRLIVDEIMDNVGHHNLVVSKRLEHLAIIQDLLEERGFPDPILTLTGQDSNEARQEAKSLAETSPCLILSTLADEALDIPRLDRLYLVFPQRNSGLVTQQVGRVERVHPDKKDAVIYDFADLGVGPLEKQWRIRRFEVYEPRTYKIIKRRFQKG